MERDIRARLSNRARIWRQLEQFLPALGKMSGYAEDEIFPLAMSILRARELDVTAEREVIVRNTSDISLLEHWIRQTLVPNTVVIRSADPDLLKAVAFSLAVPYKVFAGEVQASYRTKNAYFGRVFSDTFIGKIGEIAFKKYAYEKFGLNTHLDWAIGRNIGKYQSDLVDSTGVISIKSTDTLESIWAEAPPHADYGIFIKVALPKDFFMKILAHISSLKKLLRFVESNTPDDAEASELIQYVEKTAYEEEMVIRAFVCGFFRTLPETLKHEGLNLPYLGEVHGDKHLLECSKLSYAPEDWKAWLSSVFPRTGAGH